MSAPRSSRCVAKLCRSEWGVVRLSRPGHAQIFFQHPRHASRGQSLAESIDEHRLRRRRPGAALPQVEREPCFATGEARSRAAIAAKPAGHTSRWGPGARGGPCRGRGARRPGNPDRCGPIRPPRSPAARPNTSFPGSPDRAGPSARRPAGRRRAGPSRRPKGSAAASGPCGDCAAAWPDSSSPSPPAGRSGKSSRSEARCRAMVVLA